MADRGPTRGRGRRRARSRGVVLLTGCLAATLLVTAVLAAVGPSPGLGGRIGASLSVPASAGRSVDYAAVVRVRTSDPVRLLAARVDRAGGYRSARLVHVGVAPLGRDLSTSYAGWPPTSPGDPAVPVRGLPMTVTGAPMILLLYGLVADGPGVYGDHGITVTYRVGSVTRHVTSGEDTLMCIPRACSQATFDRFH